MIDISIDNICFLRSFKYSFMMPFEEIPNDEILREENIDIRTFEEIISLIN